MEIEDSFEEWDELEIFEMLDENELENDGNDSESSESENSEEDDELKCSKCNKIYHVLGWLTKHEKNCDGKKKEAKKNKEMTQHQKHVREVLTDLGFDDYYREKCIPAILALLQDLSGVDEETAKLRGPRFVNCKVQAIKITPEVQVNHFFNYLASKIWTICFSKDNLLRSSTRQMHIAQELHALRNCQILKANWVELIHSVGACTDELLLQKMITTIFGDICQYRAKSLEQALVRDSQLFDKATPVSLSNVEKDIVSYVGGYVGRKVRDRLQRYVTSNSGSKNVKVQEKCHTFHMMVQFISSQVIVKGSTAIPSAMTFPNLMTLSLNRGGLSSISHPTFTFFCYLELSIRPFLILTKLRGSDRMADTKLLKELLDNSSILRSAFPCIQCITPDDNNLLLMLFTELYYRVRKWAYLKVYKENKKCKETKKSLKDVSSKSTVSLHGKDSIRKALMNNNKM